MQIPRMYFWFAFKPIKNAYVLDSLKHHIKQYLGIYLATPHLGIHWALYTAKRILESTKLLTAAPPLIPPK